MTSIVFVTSNPDKARDLERELGVPLEHRALDLYEVQSLDLKEVLEAKAREAYTRVQKPVIVDDVSVVFTELNGLPGPFIKWFLESIGNGGLCRLADLTKKRSAVVQIGIGYCDGEHFEAFMVRKNGVIAKEPRGTNGYGWDAIFIQEGYEVTQAEMDDQQYFEASIRKPVLDALRSYLKSK